MPKLKRNRDAKNSSREIRQKRFVCVECQGEGKIDLDEWEKSKIYCWACNGRGSIRMKIHESD